MTFSSYLSFPLVTMLLTSHSFMKREASTSLLNLQTPQVLSSLDFCLTCLPVLGLTATKPSVIFTPAPRLLTFLEEKDYTTVEIGHITN